jgi:glycosyltransferase involved in cell wall biosynthesis
MDRGVNRPGIAVVLSGFPRRSETFALNELLALERNGLLAAVFATKPGDGREPHPGVARLKTPVELLSTENSSRKDAKSAKIKNLANFAPLREAFIAEDSLAKELAAKLVAQLDGRPIAAIHAYFAHLPAAVAACAARQLGVPFGFSTHARDARKVDQVELYQRARAAACVVACNEDVATELCQSGVTVHLLPHGVDTQRFLPQPPPAGGPLRLLAVGRLVEKKGFAVLLAAVTRLSFPFELRIVGDGPLQATLERMIQQAGLEDRVKLCAGTTHAALPQLYANAHVVVVPSVVDSSGDRDGLPNVVLEAMACGRPVLASEVGAISSAVGDGLTGLLVPPGDAAALANRLTWLADHPGEREQMGRLGRVWVERDFELAQCSDNFCRLLESVYIKGNRVIRHG